MKIETNKFKNKKSSSVMGTILSLTLLFVVAPSSFATGPDGNGTDRGGGDEYVAEFQNYKRTVLSLEEYWFKDGTLKFSDADQKKFRRIAPTIKIFSLEHVYLVKNDPSTEVTILNQKKLLPPRITLGRLRWSQLLREKTSIEIEMMVLHELLSACGIQDSEFEKSYATKLNAIEKLKEFKIELLRRLSKLNQTFSQFLNAFNLDAPKAFMEAIYLDTDYENCMSHPGTDKKSLEFQKEYCLPLSLKLAKAFEIVAKRSFEKTNVVATEEVKQMDELNIWLSANQDKASYLLAQTVSDNIQSAWSEQYNKFLGDVKDLASSFRDLCPNHEDMTLSTACVKNFHQNIFFPKYEQLNREMTTEVLKVIDAGQTAVDLFIK